MNKPVTFFCGGRDVPASRFRVEPVASYLADTGWDVNTVYGYGNLDHRLGNGLIRRAYRAGCRISRYVKTASYKPAGPVVVQRLAWPWNSGAERLLARNAEGFVFDFDDAVFLGGNGKVSGSRDNALKQVFRASDRVVAGNSWLAEYASDFGDVTVIPTCIDTRKYSPEQKVGEGIPVVGWIGTSGNFPYLSQLVASIKRLRADGFKFRFVICSDAVDRRLFADLGAEFVKWNAKDEVKILQDFDIGLMPLFDNDWCKGKCSFKLIQYKAVGIPSIGSAVGFNKDVIIHEETGFLVDSSDWYQPLKRLITEPDLRRAMGEAARSRAVSSFDVSFAGDQYQKLLGEFLK
jgi:glycosyltransferase involved in cell wall biosynthesis